MENRSADNVRDFLRGRILFRNGTPKLIHSDHACKLVGHVITRLAVMFDYSVTSTNSYCLSCNLTIASFWQFCNVCLHFLSNANYVDVKSYVQHIAWAWNTTYSSSISVWPFKIMHGVTPVMLTDSLELSMPSTNTINVGKNVLPLAHKPKSPWTRQLYAQVFCRNVNF